MTHDFTTRPELEFYTLAELAARVDAAGPRRWLIRGIWPAGDYGIHASTPKAQKTWNTCDLAVSVASGTPWLGRFPIDTPGPVIMFVGEGGEANTVRRLRATGEARGIAAEQLPIVVCTRAPQLGNSTHLGLMAAQIEQYKPALVSLDPLYLSIGKDAQTSSLSEMGALLQRPQLICQQFGASLFVVHHDRKTGKDTGGGTGVGGAEWGRVLIAAELKSQRTDTVTGSSDVIINLSIRGGEIPDQGYRVTRRIWADDPDDLDSPLHLAVDVDTAEAGDTTLDSADPASTLPPAAQKLLEQLSTDEPRTAGELVDRVAAAHGHGLKRPTVSTSLNKLRSLGLADFHEVDPSGGQFPRKMWFRVPPQPTVSAVSATRHHPQVADASALSAPPLGADGAMRHGPGDTAPEIDADTVSVTNLRPADTWLVEQQPVKSTA